MKKLEGSEIRVSTAELPGGQKHNLGQIKFISVALFIPDGYLMCFTQKSAANRLAGSLYQLYCVDLFLLVKLS